MGMLDFVLLIVLVLFVVGTIRYAFKKPPTISHDTTKLRNARKGYWYRHRRSRRRDSADRDKKTP